MRSINAINDLIDISLFRYRILFTPHTWTASILYPFFAKEEKLSAVATRLNCIARENNRNRCSKTDQTYLIGIPRGGAAVTDKSS